MAGTNTEKPTGKAEQKKIAAPTKEVKPKAEKAPVQEKTQTKKEETKPTEAKKEKKQTVKVKKSTTSVNISSMPVSTKVAGSICKFIKYKPIKTAIADLEEVTKLKKAVPMKGEIPHRKGKIMSGRFPKRAAEEFLVIVKSLQSNANNFDMEEPVISEAIANLASRPFAKGGRARKKSTHVKIVAMEKKEIKQKRKKE